MLYYITKLFFYFFLLMYPYFNFLKITVFFVPVSYPGAISVYLCNIGQCLAVTFVVGFGMGMPSFSYVREKSSHSIQF